MTKCCHCIPLKLGVLITSLLVILGSIFMTVKISLDIAYGENLFKYAKGSTISLAALYGLVAIGGMLGFFVITCVNSSKMLLDYSRLEFGFVGLTIFFHIKVIVEIVLCKSIVLEECTRTLMNKYNYSLFQAEYFLDGACEKAYNDGLVIIGSLCFILILVLVFYSLLISTYSYQRKNEEYITGPSDHNRVSPIIPTVNMPNRPNGLANGTNIPMANNSNGPNSNGPNTNVSSANGPSTNGSTANGSNANGSNVQTTNGSNAV